MQFLMATTASAAADRQTTAGHVQHGHVNTRVTMTDNRRSNSSSLTPTSSPSPSRRQDHHGHGGRRSHSALSLLDSMERRTQRTYRYGIGLVCIGATLNWLGFAQGHGYVDPLRYLGVACVISGSFCVCLAMCRWLGKPISTVSTSSSHRIAIAHMQDDVNSHSNGGDVHVINVSVPMYIPTNTKPPEYDLVVRSNSIEPPPYDEAIKLSPGQLTTATMAMTTTADISHVPSSPLMTTPIPSPPTLALAPCTTTTTTATFMIPTVTGTSTFPQHNTSNNYFILAGGHNHSQRMRGEGPVSASVYQNHRLISEGQTTSAAPTTADITNLNLSQQKSVAAAGSSLLCLATTTTAMPTVSMTISSTTSTGRVSTSTAAANALPLPRTPPPPYKSTNDLSNLNLPPSRSIPPNMEFTSPSSRVAVAGNVNGNLNLAVLKPSSAINHCNVSHCNNNLPDQSGNASGRRNSLGSVGGIGNSNSSTCHSHVRYLP